MRGKTVIKSKLNLAITAAVVTFLSACAGTSQLIPAGECPRPALEYQEYAIGTGDSLDIFVWGNPDLSGTVRVRADGRVSLPLIEDVMVVGKSPTELAREIETWFAEFVRKPKVNVLVSAEGSANQVQIVGQVVTPKAVPYRVSLSVLDVIVAAGGLGEFAAGNGTKLVRNVDSSLVECRIRLDDLVKRGSIDQNIPLFPGDVIIVPEAKF